MTLLRKEKNITQEQLAEMLNVSRQSVSRWEKDAAFPETDKLIQLSRLFTCSIDCMIYTNDRALFIVTDKRKNVYAELVQNSHIAIVACNAHTQKWLRLYGRAIAETSIPVREAVMNAYPTLKQTYAKEAEMFLAIFKLLIDDSNIT